MKGTTHLELVRLVVLLDVYENALAELESLRDPAVAGLVARLTALQRRVALDLFSEYDIGEIEHVRRMT